MTYTKRKDGSVSIKAMTKFLPSFIWTVALSALFFMDTSASTSLCLAKLAGFHSCWGCGIGRSIHHTLHFQFAEAIKHHWLGIPSAIALLWLIIRSLIKKHTPYEPSRTDINDAGYSAR